MDLKEQLKKAMEDLEKLERKKEKFLADYDEKILEDYTYEIRI